MTTTKAPFIEQAKAAGRLYIDQPYELYSEANHEVWRRLFARMTGRWERYANHRFLKGSPGSASTPNGCRASRMSIDS